MKWFGYSSTCGGKEQFHDIKGVLRGSLGKGFNVIRQKDGTVKKVFVK